jgi:ubiquitin-conjugating enzyme E2 D/E
MGKVNSTTEMRIKKEISNIMKEKNEQIDFVPCIGGNLHHWKAVLKPSKTSVYEGMELEVAIVLPNDYPYEPPHITFLTEIFHPNINKSGGICISTLNKDWSPALTVESTLLSIMSLLDKPNASDPLRADAAEVYLTSEENYISECRKVWNKVKREQDTNPSNPSP